jgi:hypothetical protein
MKITGRVSKKFNEISENGLNVAFSAIRGCSQRGIAYLCIHTAQVLPGGISDETDRTNDGDLSLSAQGFPRLPEVAKIAVPVRRDQISIKPSARAVLFLSLIP